MYFSSNIQKVSEIFNTAPTSVDAQDILDLKFG